MHDDNALAPEKWEPELERPDLVSYMAVREDGKLIGMFIVLRHSLTMWELHDCFLPCAWGRKARRAAREFRDWIWRDTQCRTLIGKIVGSNRPALEYAKAAGMQVWGVIPRCFLKDGVYQDQIIVGISRPGEVNQ